MSATARGGFRCFAAGVPESGDRGAEPFGGPAHTALVAKRQRATDAGRRRGLRSATSGAQAGVRRARASGGSGRTLRPRPRDRQSAFTSAHFGDTASKGRRETLEYAPDQAYQVCELAVTARPLASRRRPGESGVGHGGASATLLTPDEVLEYAARAYRSPLRRRHRPSVSRSRADEVRSAR
ncbi:hypothetical protein EAO69_08485 [Streptomyces sp. me109]|nr:hypothetical protein EAO69_08485 [Streptomyces sp. me109]